MKYLHKLLLLVASAAFFVASAQAQNAGTVTANEIPVGKGPGVQGFGTTYTPSGTGATPRTVRSKLDEIVSVTDLGADCSGTVDGTTAVSNAITKLGAGGGTIVIPNGCFVKISGSGTEIFLITKPVRFKCQGLGSGGFVVTASTSATTDIFRIAPASNTTLYQTGMSGCQVIPASGTPGRHVWNFDTSAGGSTTVISEFLAEDNYFGTFGNYVFFNNTNAGVTASGGIYSGHFVRNVCAGSGSATAGGCFGGANWGDSNHVNGGRMAGTGYAVNISLFASGGAGNFILENANIVSSSMVKIDGGYKIIIQNNTLEQQLYTNTSTNNAVIDLNGGSAAVVNATVVGNLIVVGSGLGNPTPLRINNASATVFDNNRFTTPSAYAPVTTTASASSTYVGCYNVISGGGTYSFTGGTVAINLCSSSAKSVLGVAGNSGNVADIQATVASQFFGVNAPGNAIGFQTMAGDCTLSGGNITCTKTNGSAFATSATTDATNATNISSGTLAVARGGVDQTSWSTWTPTLAMQVVGGTPATLTSNSARYKQIGKIVYFVVDVTITNVGVGNSSGLLISLPVTASGSAILSGSGKEIITTGYLITMPLNSTTQAVATFYNNASLITGGNGTRIQATGFYESP